jgi:PHD-finger
LKEAAMIELARHNYDRAKLKEIVTHLVPNDGSTWSNAMKESFHEEMFTCRKDLRKVSKALNLPYSSCMTYYLGTFKHSNDYRFLKTVCIEERLRKAELADFIKDTCAVCGDGGNLLICDECEAEFHLACVKPPLASVPEGRWECDDCVDKKVLSLRDDLIQNSKLFEFCSPQSLEGDDSSESRTLNDNYRPTDSVLAIVRAFAKDITSALCDDSSC